MNTEQTWKSVLGSIQVQVSKPNFLTWFKNSRLIKKDDQDGTVTVGLPNNFAKEWVKNRYHKIILGALRDLDPTIKHVDYAVISGESGQPVKLKQKTKKQSPTDIQDSLIEVKIDSETNLSLRYSLDNFVVGQSNELAHAAVRAMVDSVGTKYNPLFIYGKVGVGKTHLIQAAGNEITKKYKKRVKVFYVTSEKFTNDVVWAIRNKRMEDLKQKYRDVDVLIIDDIQFIGGKAATEQEFFHTFNALYEQNKQIILSSDRSPSAIPTLEERLRSRFEGGMIADVGYPDYETRLAILKNKVAVKNVDVDDRVLEIIATKIQKNVRELEGVLNKVIFYQEFKNEKIDSKKLDSIISEVAQVSSKNITASDILRIVADFFEITQQDLVDKSRRKEVTVPRQICMYLMRDVLKMSYPHIGDILGKRDHTTAIHAFEKISKDINSKPEFNQQIMLIKERLY